MKIIFIDRNKSLVSKVKKAIKFLPKEWNVSAKFGSKKIHGKMMRMMFLKDKKYD